MESAPADSTTPSAAPSSFPGPRMRNPLRRPGAPPPSASAGGPALQLVGTVSAPSAPTIVQPGECTVAAGAGETPPAVREQLVLAERRKRHAELMERRALRRADDADAAVGEATARLDRLEHELAEARRDVRRLAEKLEQAQRKRREAEQLAHSETALRLELVRDHAERLERDEADAAELTIARSTAPDAMPVGSPVADPVVAELREQLEQERSLRERLEAGAHPGPRVQTAGAVAPDRLAAALLRLREESPRPDHESAAERRGVAVAPPGAALPPAASWLEPTMKRLLRESPAIAGSVAIQLLPAQHLVSGPVRYDLALGDAGCLAVTVEEGQVRVERFSEPRPLGEVGFRIEGDLAGLGRLLVYGALRRRLSRRVARVRGDRAMLRALADLVRAPLGLDELDSSGVRLDPRLALQLVACMIDVSWTRGERFTLGHESRGGEDRAYLLVRDGATARVLCRPPLGPVTTTIRCAPEQLLTLLAGGSASEVTVLGAAEPLALLRAWVARAERGV